METDEWSEMPDEWTQTSVIHCPNKNCKGVLLTNPLKHELKCSYCGKYFLLFCEYKEVKLNSSKD